LLPELPRLVHQALLHRRDSDPATLALLAEQRRTNRLLQALLYAAVGFVAGVLATQLALRWAA
jgi:ubiquinone biosynthesis protein